MLSRAAMCSKRVK
ncbi:hypothetical protein E2C01_085853 [Portunus trituberculatus]|uniref:Uncharacterized protein n=1 Tax=Portunus trituberculatus TaxID=210409 RepID=A0A5B7J246_PORTR|nr:hypothetical protein [Portunus trituberculatus]